MTNTRKKIRYRRVIELRERGLTFREIGEKLNGGKPVSRQRVWQMYERALKRPDLVEVSI